MKKLNNIADNHFKLDLQFFNNTPAAPAGDSSAAAPTAAPDPVSASPEPAPAPAAGEGGASPVSPAPGGEPITGSPAGSGNPLLDLLQSGKMASKYDPSKIPGHGPQAQPASAQLVSQPAQPPVGQPPAQPAAQPPAQAPAVPQPTEQPKILGKFNTPEDMARSYTELERKLSEQGETIRQFRESQAQPPVQQPGQQPPAQQPVELTPEKIKELNEKFVETILDPEKNPIETLSKIIKQAVEPMIAQVDKKYEPVQQTVEHQNRVAEWNQKVDTFKTNNPDYGQFEPEITQIIKEQGQHLVNLPDPLQAAYDMAKGRKAQNLGPPPPVPTLEDMLNDPANIEKLVQNPQIQQRILSQTVNSIKGGAPPVVIANQPGGTPPAAPAEAIHTVADATKAAKNFFSKILHGGG